MNRIHVAPWVALAFLAVLSGCKGAAPPETFPQAAADGWLGSFNGGDVAGLALMYGADAEILPPDEPIVSGYEAIEAFWQTYNPGQVRIEVSEVETLKLGEFWYREGAYAATYPDEGDSRIGKFIELWKLDGKAWKLYRQMWSPNSPQPAQMPPDDEPA
jgi:ketosteroid isomerase-like protein